MQLSGKYNVTYSEEHHNDVAKGRSDGVDKCTGTQARWNTELKRILTEIFREGVNLIELAQNRVKRRSLTSDFYQQNISIVQN